MNKILKPEVANGLPIAEGKPKAYIYLLITICLINRSEKQKSMK
jgi:hypothetical protein